MTRNTVWVLGLGLLVLAGCAKPEPKPDSEKAAAPVVAPSPSATPVPSYSPKAKEPAAPSRPPVLKPLPKPPSSSSKAPKAETYDSTESNLPKALQEVEKRYAEAGTLFAEFKQLNETAATGQKKESQGILYAKRPGKVRWETRSPDANLLVSDGKKFWFYTPPFDEDERGQLIERKASEVQTKLANALLSGSFSIVHDMKIEEKGANRFVLYPNRGTAGTIKRAEIAIDRKRGIIQTVILEHEGGNRSEIQLSKIELGRKLGEELFNFVAPPNTDRLNP